MGAPDPATAEHLALIGRHFDAVLRAIHDRDWSAVEANAGRTDRAIQRARKDLT